MKNVGIKKGLVNGFSIGFLYMSMYSMYGLSFWYGSIQVIESEIQPGDLATTFFGILISAFALGAVSRNV